MVRISVIALFLASQVALASYAFARNNANLSREQIRSMHILDRPSRPGHFYGNAVRRKHGQVQSGSVRANPGNVYQSPASYGTTYGGSFQTGGMMIYGQ
jgi:hypothetical protein